MAVVSFLFQAEIESDGESRQASEEGAWVVKKDAAYFQARSQFHSLCIFVLRKCLLCRLNKYDRR